MKRVLIILLMLWALLPALAAGPAGAADFITEPWNLALVLDGSRALDRPWVNSTPRAALSPLLQMELRSLPLRVSAGVWLSRRGGAKLLVPPAKSLDLKGINLALPPGSQTGDLLPGIKAALAWLARSGGGSLLVVSAGPTIQQLDIPAAFGLNQPEVFCHVLELGAKAPAPGLARLVLAAGGGLGLVEKPSGLGLRLHRAVLDAISPANLLVKAANPQNQPIETVYRILRRGRRTPPRPARTGRKAQLTAGGYGLSWPKPDGIGPGRPPAHAELAPSGTTLLWAGGLAELLVTPLGPTKSKRPWRIKVSRSRDGKVVMPFKHAPFELSLPTGHYLVSSMAPPQIWKLNLAAGQKLTLGIGLPGGLTLKLNGPGGPVRAPYEARPLLEDRRPYTGYTGQRLKLLPGPYRLKILITPPLWREAKIEPGGALSLALPPVGKLSVRNPKGNPLSYTLLDRKGRLLSKGRGGKLLFIQPGSYLVKAGGLSQAFKVGIKAGQVTTLQTPGPKP